MAGKRDPFERTIFRDGNRASRLLEQTAGESVQKMSNSRDVTAEVIKDPRSAARRFKSEENSSNRMQFPRARIQENADDPGIGSQVLLNQPSVHSGAVGQISQGHQQGPTAWDQNQNIAGMSVSQDLPGIVPPREISTFPQNADAVVGGVNYRRKAVCQETDGALGQRTKMRVYMKRF